VDFICEVGTTQSRLRPRDSSDSYQRDSQYGTITYHSVSTRAHPFWLNRNECVLRDEKTLFPNIIIHPAPHYSSHPESHYLIRCCIERCKIHGDVPVTVFRSLWPARRPRKSNPSYDVSQSIAVACKAIRPLRGVV